MCLITTDPTIWIADEDIKVYKRVDPHQADSDRKWYQKLFGTNKMHIRLGISEMGYFYEMGKVNPTVILRPKKWVYFFVEEGYHSDTSPHFGANALFVIPKGTRYIKGWFNNNRTRQNYVSETIIFKEFLY